MKLINKRIISLLLALVMLCGMMPMTAFAVEETETNPWSGRSAVFVGDSITAGAGTTKIYYQYLEEMLDLGSVTAMGVGGSCISAASDYGTGNQPLINRYQNIPSTDLIVIFMGTNDYGHETPLGSVGDTKDGTFYGALNTIVPALVAKHTSSKIVFVTPLHRYGFGTSKILGTQFTYDNIPNGVGATLGDYVNALKTVCANNGVTVIDLYTECTLDPTDSAVRSIYIPDGLHPNAAGHELIAGIMESHIREYEPVKIEPIVQTELIQGNKFSASNDQPCRASSRVNYYLKAGTVITLRDPDVMQWACAKTNGEISSTNLGYFPDSQWTDKETAVVAEDGWVGFVFKYRDETQVFDLSKSLSEYITIEEPHTHSYKSTVTVPTCTEQGYTTYTCDCGDSYVADLLDTTGHTYENGVCTGCGVNEWDTDWDGILEILAIGNSFSVDALQYAYQIAQNLGVEEIVIGNLYIGGCTLATHAANAAGDLGKYTYYYNDNGTWTSTSSSKISTALESRSWDYVSMQQGSPVSGVESSYNQDLTNLIAYVKERSDAKLVWHMTWAYQQNSTHSAFPTYGKDQMTMYNAIVSAVQNKIVPNEHFDLIVPNGTAVQNSRTSLLGDTTTRDGYHMSYDYGRYLTGLLFVKTLTGLDISDVTYAPSGVDAEEKAIAIESVNNAAAKPFAVTQSAYVKIEPEIPDEGYILLKPELHKGAYWNATDKNRYNVLIADADNSKYFFATDRFTKEELPVGSIIVLESGWQYRPDGWITDAVQSSRADTTTESYVVVTEEWWGDYTIRGFNISKVGTPSLMSLNVEDIHKAFRIYAPEEKHSHNYTSVVTAPNCTEQGYTTYTCACGDSYVADYVDATGDHTYENGSCIGCGKTVSPYLQQLPENVIGCTNLYDVLTPVKGYYTATKYDTSNGEVLSVVIPVEPGDRIAASSFASKAQNMGSADGIRVTYLLGDQIVTSLSAGDVYSAYTADGYITVPEGVDTVSIPWWKPSDSNWLTLSQISKDFAVHSPKTVPVQEPTCTENGYTAGEICEICNVSLGEREEIPAAGHTYSGSSCSVCGAVNLAAILNGKYVSVLGDSISTFNGYSNDAAVNSTIGGNGPRYDVGVADTKPGSYCLLESVNDTWWMNFANRSGMKLLVNNSWAGSQVFGGKTGDGRVIPAAYLERCVNLHDNTLENNPGNAPIKPDVIFVYLGINDYNFNRSNVGTGAVDYAGLVNADGSYVTPANFGEAYGIMLHKIQTAYPDARIFAMTLLPENLYSVDMTAWEQHNAYIRAAAEYYDIPVVDLAANCAITWENYSGYMMDKIHPTTAGMKLICDCIEAELQSYYTNNPPHVHTYENGICTGCGANQPGPVITQQPVDGEAKLGERYMVEVKVEGEGLKYQWYFRNAGSKNFSKSSVKDNTYDDVMTEARAGREVYCVITDSSGNSVKTDTATLICIPSEELAIIKQPTDGEAVLGERYCVNVEAKGDGLKYQWYFRNKGANHWTKSSVRDNTYDDVMTTARDGREVYCVITDLAGNKVTTDIVKLMRVPMKLEITSQPTDATAHFNEKFCATVVAKGEGLKYQWYYRKAGTSTWYRSGVRDNTYDDIMNKSRNGREVYCVITDKYGNSVTTDTVKLIAIPKVGLKLLGVTYEAAAMGERYCVTVEAQGDGLSYQWYFRNAGATRWSKSSVRDHTYNDVMNKTRANREVYCVITDAFGNQITTDVITLSLEK